MNPASCFLVVIPVGWLWAATGFMLALSAGLLAYVAHYLRSGRRLTKSSALCRRQFSDVIAEISLCESDDERETVLRQPYITSICTRHLQHRRGRRLFIKELVRSKDNLSGEAAQNLQWLYERLRLHEDSFRLFLSKKWHRKAGAIQQLAEMQQSRYLLKIYRETNSRNEHVRTEAQIAVVKLTGFKGLRFLNIVSHPVTQWQQLCLLDQVKETEIETGRIRQWLSSSNETVVEFALRLTQVFRCVELHNDIVPCLQHASASVRLQALQVMKEIGDENSVDLLCPLYAVYNRAERLLLLEVLTEIGGAAAQRFLHSLLPTTDETLRHRISAGLANSTTLLPFSATTKTEAA